MRNVIGSSFEGDLLYEKKMSFIYDSFMFGDDWM